jgi:hypothetical protein
VGAVFFIGGKVMPYPYQLEAYYEAKIEHLEKAHSKLEEHIKVLEDAVKRAYRKHWLNDPDIGWHELGEVLHDALCNSLGDKGFVEWLNEYRAALEVKP